MKVLVVEDEHRIANYIKKGLAHESMVVDVAFDGEEGYDLASSEDYDVLILDRMLPQMDGLEICKNLRKEHIHTPILMLTAKGSTSDKVEGLEAGADDYLPKPFAFAELVARVRALSRRPEHTNDSILKVGELEVNTNSFEVTRSGKKVSLSKKEFALLEFFVQNHGQVFSPEQLTEKVWSYDSDVLPNTAQVYIGYLRKKLDKNFSDKPALIKTVRGFGYKLDGGDV